MAVYNIMNIVFDIYTIWGYNWEQTKELKYVPDYRQITRIGSK